MSTSVHAGAPDSGDVILRFDDNALLLNLCGERNANLRLIEKALQIKLNLRGDRISLVGEEADVKVAKRVLEELYSLLSEGYPLYPNDVTHAIQILSGNFRAKLREIFLDAVYVTAKKRVITPKTLVRRNTLMPFDRMISSSA